MSGNAVKYRSRGIGFGCVSFLLCSFLVSVVRPVEPVPMRCDDTRYQYCILNNCQQECAVVLFFNLISRSFAVAGCGECHSISACNRNLMLEFVSCLGLIVRRLTSVSLTMK
jgi:hypothetical protein